MFPQTQEHMSHATHFTDEWMKVKKSNNLLKARLLQKGGICAKIWKKIEFCSGETEKQKDGG